MPIYDPHRDALDASILELGASSHRNAMLLLISHYETNFVVCVLGDVSLLTHNSLKAFIYNL